MNISKRYKILGKKRYARLDMPIDKVLDIFENALSNNNAASRLCGTVDRESGVFKIEYKISSNKKYTYENYCMLVTLVETEDGGTKIEYVFVYDRFMSFYTALLSVICFIVPLASALFIYFQYELRTAPYLALYIPLLLVSSFGVFSLIAYKERKSDVKPMIKEFEQLLINAFEE